MKVPVAPLVFLVVGIAGVVLQLALDPGNHWVLLFYVAAGLAVGGFITLVRDLITRRRT
jgi:hypothetical protein